jgi:hypothetical protein
MKKSILAVGSVAFDSIKTPSGFVEKALGGSANYFSIAASFYNPLFIVGVVGEDFPKEHLQWLSTRGINGEGVCHERFLKFLKNFSFLKKIIGQNPLLKYFG